MLVVFFGNSQFLITILIKQYILIKIGMPLNTDMWDSNFFTYLDCKQFEIFKGAT